MGSTGRNAIMTLNKLFVLFFSIPFCSQLGAVSVGDKKVFVCKFPLERDTSPIVEPHPGRAEAMRIWTNCIGSCCCHDACLNLYAPLSLSLSSMAIPVWRTDLERKRSVTSLLVGNQRDGTTPLASNCTAMTTATVSSAHAATIHTLFRFSSILLFSSFSHNATLKLDHPIATKSAKSHHR